jgi:hypothetical protein
VIQIGKKVAGDNREKEGVTGPGARYKFYDS